MNSNKKGLLVLASLTLVGLLAACNQGGGNSSDSSSSSPDSSSSSTDSSSSSQSSSSSSLPETMTGSGTQTDPYVISNATQFLNFAKTYNASTELGDFKYYTLGDDIDLEGKSFDPIGNDTVPFYGSFDGKKHSITGVSLYNFTKGTTTYGLFGSASSSFIYDLALSVDFDFSPMGAKSYIYVGGLVGNAYNTVIENVMVNGSISLSSAQNSSSVLVVGGIAGMLQAGENTYVGLTNSTSIVDVTCDMSDSDDTTNAVGGIAGAVVNESSSSSVGLYAITTSYYEGSLKGGSVVGGVSATISTYTSIVDCYATGESLETTDTDASYVGGILGQGYYETAVLHNFSSFASIKAAPSSNTYYKSYAGTSIGYAYKNGYDYSSNIDGTVNYANYSTDLTPESDNIGVNGIVTEEGAKALEDAGLSSSWSIVNGEVALAAKGEEEQVNVTFSSNFDGGSSQDETISWAKGTFDNDSVAAAMNKEFVRSGYSYVGLFYDEEGQQPFCYFAPVVTDTNLYASYGDLSLIEGTWTANLQYYTTTLTSTWYFTEDTFYWQNRYYETNSYSYTFDGTYIFIGEGTGGYDGEIFKYENGQITGYDIATSNEYLYTATRSSTAFVLPDYKGESFIGDWYFSNGKHVVLGEDGNGVGYSDSGVAYYGGFTKLSDDTFNIRVPAILMADGLHYDADKDVFYSDSYFGAREKITATYSTGDSTVKVYLTDSASYALSSGELVEVSGSFEDGETVTIGGNEYTVSGTTLTAKATPTPTPSIPEEICGTYKSSSNITILLNSDGTGTYDGSYAFTWTYDSSTGTAKLSQFGDWDTDSNSITWNSDGSITVHLEDEYGENIVSALKMTKVEDKEQTAGYVGTWAAKTLGGTNTIVLNEDGTGTYNGTSFTYSVSGSTITFSVGDMDVTLTYNESAGTMTGSFEQDYETYNFTSITKVEEEEVPGYVGTWTAKTAFNTITIVINADGTGTYNGNSFSYTVSGSTITFSVGDTDVTLTYSESTGMMSGTYDYDYETYSFSSITKVS